jgi:hypothetical protein
LRRVATRYRVIVPSLLADVRADTLEVPAPIAPDTDPRGGTIFTPQRYRVTGQWDRFQEEPQRV